MSGLIEAIEANSIHEKQLAPHLRKRLRGLESSVSYVQSTVTVINEIATDKLTELEAVEAIGNNTFGHISGGKVYLADHVQAREAHCFVVEGTDMVDSDIVKVVFSDIIIKTTEEIDGGVFLGMDGNITSVVPVANFVQVLGSKISPNSFLLKIRNPWWIIGG
jgi:hypothetical protein